MRLRDDLSSSQRQEDNSLIRLTITRASCQHTHTLWGAVQNKNKGSCFNILTAKQTRILYVFR